LFICETFIVIIIFPHPISAIAVQLTPAGFIASFARRLQMMSHEGNGQLFLQYFDAVGLVVSPVKLSPG